MQLRSLAFVSPFGVFAFFHTSLSLSTTYFISRLCRDFIHFSIIKSYMVNSKRIIGLHSNTAGFDSPTLSSNIQIDPIWSRKMTHNQQKATTKWCQMGAWAQFNIPEKKKTSWNFYLLAISDHMWYVSMITEWLVRFKNDYMQYL